MLQTKVLKKIKTHILCLITFFLNHAIYEIMWKNAVEPDTPNMTIYHSLNAILAQVRNCHLELKQ